MNLRVPYISEDAIERDAAALLAQYASAKRVELRAPIPIEDIVEKHLKLRIEFDDLHRLLNVPRSGPSLDADIFGAIWVDSGRVVIDESLDPEVRPAMEGRYRFTLAHEGGGHWRLHRGLVGTDSDQGALFTDVSTPKVICRSSQAAAEAVDDALFENVAERIARRFGVSRTAMRIRLEKLGLLLRAEPRQQPIMGIL